jgi:uncharacterized protein YecT (DUF1311 family)
VGELADWVHLEAIQAIVHHATAAIAAIFLFAVTARLIAYLIPAGHLKRVVIIVDDIILLAIFVLCGWRLLAYLWERPHGAEVALTNQTATHAAIGHVNPATPTDRSAGALQECREVAQAPAGLGPCLQQKVAQAQQSLDRAGEQITSDMRALDQVGSAKVGAQKSFDASQRAFNKYREAECRWRSTAAASSSVAGDI